MKRVFIILIIAGFATGAFYYLQYHYNKQEVAIWDLIPKNTLLVYETAEPVKVWNDFLTLPFWENMSSIPNIGKLNEYIIHLDSTAGPAGELNQLFSNSKLLFSLHKVSNTGLDIIIYLPLNSVQKRKIINGILLSYYDQEEITLAARIFEDFEIHEVHSENNKILFSFIEYKGYFIGSFTSFLIDDVIRNISNDFEGNFRMSVAGIFENKPIETDEGNIYINMGRLPELIRTFSDPLHKVSDQLGLQWISEASYYDLSFEGNRIFLNGSASLPPDDNQYFLETFQGQQPQPVNMINYLPGFTASFFTYTCSDFITWRKDVDEYWQSHFPALMDRKKILLQTYEILERDFYQWIGNEIGLASLRSIDISAPDQLLFIRTGQPREGLQMLDELTLLANHKNGDTLLYEAYADRTIKMLNIPEFPSKIFGEAFHGFEASYYTAVDDYVVLGNSFDVIKVMLNDIEDGNTWGKSLKFIQFFDNIQKNANITYCINFTNAWNGFLQGLNDTWKAYFREYDHQFKHFELISFQFSNINNHFYTSAAIEHRARTAIIETPTRFLKEQVVVTDNPIVTKPFVVRSHLDRSLEVALQDSANYLYLIAQDGQILWKDSIGERIIGDIRQIDFYRNGKLQYFFATRSAMHIIDRNGNYVTGYPVYFKDAVNVEWVNVIDYDNSRKYRFLIAGTEGRMYLYDKYGELLEGWDPVDMQGGFTSTPFHLRVGGRDAMINVQSSGRINMLTRRGDFYPGFPLNFETGISGAVFIQRGSGFNNTLMHVMKDNGELIKLNLKGEIISKKQLYRPGSESYFEIIPDVLKNTYIIGQQNFNSISILLPDGDILFEKELLFSGRLKIQYYNFSTGNEIYAFTDDQQGFTYMYNSKGDLINSQPVESSHEISLIFSEVNNNYKLYSSYGNQFSISTFFRR